MRRLAASIKEGASYAKERSDFAWQVKNGARLDKAHGAMVDLRERPKVGRKMVKIGTAMVLTPEPFGDIPGGILILGGLAMAKYRDPTGLADLKPNLRKFFSEFELGSV